MSRNDWDRIGEDLRVGIRAVLASLHSETAVSRPGLYDRAKMLEAVILLEQVCTNMELMANGYRMQQPNNNITVTQIQRAVTREDKWNELRGAK